MDGGTQPGGTAAVDPAGTHVQRLFHNFLQEYRAEGDTESDEPVYVRWLRELKTAERTTLYVEFSHLLECAPAARRAAQPVCGALLRGVCLRRAAHRARRRFDDEAAHSAVEAQFYRFEPYLRKAVQARCPAAASFKAARSQARGFRSRLCALRRTS